MLGVLSALHCGTTVGIGQVLFSGTLAEGGIGGTGLAVVAGAVVVDGIIGTITASVVHWLGVLLEGATVVTGAAVVQTYWGVLLEGMIGTSVVSGGAVVHYS